MRLLTTLSGAVQQLFLYDAYGKAVAFFNNQANALTQASLESAKTSYLHDGEFHDSHINAKYLRARWQQGGRFTSLDPYSGDVYNPLTFHKYGFVHGDPVQGIDPSGLANLTESLSVSAVRTMLMRSAISMLRISTKGAVSSVGLNGLRNIAIGDEWNKGWYEAATGGAKIALVMAISPLIALGFAIFGVADSIAIAWTVLNDRSSTATERSSALSYLVLNGLFFNAASTRYQSLSGGRLWAPLFEHDHTMGVVYSAKRPSSVVLDRNGLKVTIYGQSKSSSKTPFHDSTIEATAKRMAATGKYDSVCMQLSWRTALDRMDGVLRLIPDLIGIRRDGKVDAFEVKSKTDSDMALRVRLEQGMKTLPVDRRGEYRVLPLFPTEH